MHTNKKQCIRSTFLYNIIVFRILVAGFFILINLTALSQQTLRTNLFVVGSNGSKTLVDGNMTIYDDVYCNCVNWEDALKLTNPGENWGLTRSSTTLSVERRKSIPETDTSFIRMLNLQQRNYAIQIIGRNLAKADRFAYLKDNYNNTNTSINLSDTTYIHFSVNSESSTAAHNRFVIIYGRTAPPPPALKFTSFKLLRNDAFLNVVFSVENEMLMSNYTIQHATDTLNFKDFKLIMPKNGNGTEMYNVDAGACVEGDHFYRIKASNTSGKFSYSNIAKISIPRVQQVINAYPNPSTTRQLQLQTAVTQQGKYEVRLVGINGSVYSLEALQLSSTKSLQQINLPAGLKPGMYSIQLIGPNNNIITQSVTLL